MYYKRYVDDIFALLRYPHHCKKFNEYLNKKHAHIKFPNEKEVTRSSPFLDLLRSRNYKSFTKTVYHKSTFNGVYSSFNSFIADEYKHGLIFTFFFRIFSIALDFYKFHGKVNYRKDLLKKYCFPTTLADKCIKIFLNKQFSYLGMSSLCLGTHLQESINSKISFYKIRIIIKSST